MKFIAVVCVLFFTGCSSVHSSPSSYDRQNAASKESLKSLDHE